MNLNQIAAAATAIVGIFDDENYQVARGFTNIRHQQLYESFNWTATRDIISLPILANNNTIEVPSAERVISARWSDGNGIGDYLDEVTDSYLFESFPDLLQGQIVNAGHPKFYVARYVPETQNMAIAIFPPPALDGHVLLLTKRKFPDNPGPDPLLPGIDEVMIAFVVSDLWEFIRQVGNAAQKREEANALLLAAQQRDMPAPPAPRQSKFLTTNGSTLGELTDSVCDIIQKWDVPTRESVKERLRRNYETLWMSQLWPESLYIARVPLSADQEQVVLPHFIDRVLSVRTDTGGNITKGVPLKIREIEYFFNVDPDVFERDGEAIDYTMLPSIATFGISPLPERLVVTSDDGRDDGATLYIKGAASGVIFDEVMKFRLALPSEPNPGPLPSAPSADGGIEDLGDLVSIQGRTQQITTGTVNSYDVIHTFTKEKTFGNIAVWGNASRLKLLDLTPKESERKHLRIWLKPNHGPQGVIPLPGTALVLGKGKLLPLLEEQDSPQLGNVSNALIHAAASDMLLRMGQGDQAKAHQEKAGALLALVNDAETKQNSYQPVITPFVSCHESDFDCF